MQSICCLDSHLALTIRHTNSHLRFNVLARQTTSRDPVSGRSCCDVNCAHIGWFTHHDLHPTQDIAKFHVNVDHGFAVNKFFGERSFSLSHSLLTHVELRVGAKVCKVGAAPWHYLRDNNSSHSREASLLGCIQRIGSFRHSRGFWRP